MPLETLDLRNCLVMKAQELQMLLRSYLQILWLLRLVSTLYTSKVFPGWVDFVERREVLV